MSEHNPNPDEIEAAAREQAARDLCAIMGYDPDRLTYHSIEPGVMEPWGPRWALYEDEADRLLALRDKDRAQDLATIAALEGQLVEARRDTERMDWLGQQDIIIGEASHNWLADPLLARYQKTFPADLVDIRETFDVAMRAALAATEGGAE